MLSIILPVFNSQQTIVRALSSCLDQSISQDQYEILIFDDGSTDKTVEEIIDFICEHGLDNVRVVRGLGNRGVAYARNTLIRAASGDLLAFIDSDDEWMVGRLGHLIRQHRKFGYQFYCSNIMDAHDYKKINLRRNYVKNIRLCRLNWIATSTVVCERALLVNAGEFDENLAQASDWDMWLRLPLTEVNFHYSEDSEVVIEYSTDSLSRKSQFKTWVSGARVRLRYDSNFAFALILLALGSCRLLAKTMKQIAVKRVWFV